MEPEVTEIFDTINTFETASTLETTFLSELQSSSSNAVELFNDTANTSGSNATNSKSSHVWVHFNRDSNFKTNHKVYCKYCPKSYICSKGSTSNMSKHLNKYHATKLQLPKLNIKTDNILTVLTRTKVNIYLLFNDFILNSNI